jgi:uncharacterized cupredoxin-like copper-binding protein
MIRTIPLASIICALAAPALAQDPISVDMWSKPDGMQGMTVSSDHVKAGDVIFKVTNSSTNLLHEFLIVKTDVAPDGLPTKEDGARVNEDKLQGTKELGDLPPGKSGELQMVLEPGTYVMFCNEPGHYKAGMSSKITVAP